MNSIRRYWLKSFLVVWACCVQLADAEELQTIVLSHSVDIAFQPEEAFILAEIDGSSHKVRAILVPPFSKDEQDQKKGVWWIGAPLKVPKEHEPFSYSILLKGKNRETAAILDLVGGGPDSGLEAIPSLKSALASEIEHYKSWSVQVAAQEADLKRQRSDAEVIGNIGRIVESMEEIEATKYEIENLQKDIDNLQEFFKKAKNPRTPKNFTRREIDLTKQTAELAQVAKQVESGESDRRLGAQGDLQRKLALIEATRFDDEVELAAELSRLHGQPTKNQGETLNERDYWESQ